MAHQSKIANATIRPVRHKFSSLLPKFEGNTNPLPLKEQERSAYYWWYQYLRRNEAYKAVCKRGGRGKLARLYRDFRDVHAMPFRQWWDSYGERLFAEPAQLRRVTLLDDGTASEPLDDYLSIAVPAEMKPSLAAKQLRELLEPEYKKRKVPAISKSQARYKLYTKPVPSSLKLMLQIWDMHKAQPELRLYQIADKFKIGGGPISRDISYSTKDRQLERRQFQSNVVSRYLRVAQQYIDNTTKGLFPKRDRR